MPVSLGWLVGDTCSAVRGEVNGACYRAVKLGWNGTTPWSAGRVASPQPAIPAPSDPPLAPISSIEQGTSGRARPAALIVEPPPAGLVFATEGSSGRLA